MRNKFSKQKLEKKSKDKKSLLNNSNNVKTA